MVDIRSCSSRDCVIRSLVLDGAVLSCLTVDSLGSSCYRCHFCFVSSVRSGKAKVIIETLVLVRKEHALIDLLTCSVASALLSPTVRSEKNKSGVGQRNKMLRSIRV